MNVCDTTSATLGTSKIRDLVGWVNPLLDIRPSAISGIGVFAVDGIANGQILLRLGGVLIRAYERYGEQIHPSTAVGVAEGVLLCELASSERDTSDFLNHSCQSNAGFLDAITVVSKRSIARGEEITVDYAYWEGDESWRLRSICNCGALGCRSKVTGSDWRERFLREDLLLWATPFIRRRVAALLAVLEEKEA